MNIMQYANAAHRRLGSTYGGIRQLYSSLLSARYGDRSLDVVPLLQAENDGSDTDLSDVGDNVIPDSLRADAIHPNSSGYDFIARFVYEKLYE